MSIVFEALVGGFVLAMLVIIAIGLSFIVYQVVRQLWSEDPSFVVGFILIWILASLIVLVLGRI